MRSESHQSFRQDLDRNVQDLAAVRVRFGYRRLCAMLRREGWTVNPKRVYRLYKLDGLEVRTKKRRKIASHARVPLAQAKAPNERWAMDFVSDALTEFRVSEKLDFLVTIGPVLGGQVTRQYSNHDECVWKGDD